MPSSKLAKSAKPGPNRTMQGERTAAEPGRWVVTMTVQEAISAAEALLPGDPAPDGELDPRWQAIIEVSEFIPTNPGEAWNFAMRWGGSSAPDVRAAIATCVIEHLLEQHFDEYFPKVALQAKADSNFARTVRLCWQLGQAEKPRNAAKFEALLADLRATV